MRLFFEYVFFSLSSFDFYALQYINKLQNKQQLRCSNQIGNLLLTKYLVTYICNGKMFRPFNFCYFVTLCSKLLIFLLLLNQRKPITNTPKILKIINKQKHYVEHIFRYFIQNNETINNKTYNTIEKIILDFVVST